MKLKLILFALLCPLLAVANVVVLGNNDRTLPIGQLDKSEITVITMGATANNVFADVCSAYERTNAVRWTESSHSSSGIRVALVGVFTSQRWAVEALSSLYRTGATVVPVFFIPTDKISTFASVVKGKTFVVATDAEQSEAAQALFGGQAVTGRLTSAIPGVASKGSGVSLPKTRLGYASPEVMGFSPALTSRIDSVVKVNIARHSFPGCQVVVVKDGNIVIDKAYGHQSYAPGSPAVTTSTLYDIASMSKATASLAGLMAAYDDGLFQLNQPISRYISALRNTNKEDITIRQLLTHESGLPASFNIYTTMMDPASYTGKIFKYQQKAPYTIKIENGVYGHNKARLNPRLVSTTRSARFPYQVGKNLYVGRDAQLAIDSAIYNAPLKEKKYLYSCLNFCLLKEMEEGVTGVAHDRWVDSRVFAPIGAWHACYNPTRKFSLSEIAPTETDNFLRRQTVHGFAHDEKAAFYGGVQGNAGLFSNATDIAKLCQTWLNGGVYGDRRIFSPETVRLFTTEVSRTADRGLGFDRATRVKSVRETGISPSAYGHTGFTGTCFWVDPDNNLIYVFLSNRVTPSRDNKAFTDLNPRNEILRLIYNSMN